MNTAKRRRMRSAAILLLSVLTWMLMPLSVFATEATATAVISVETQLSGDKPSFAEAFSFTLTPDDVGFPMPEGASGQTLVIHGAGTASFGAITYTEPKAYTYTLKEAIGSSVDYMYDQTVYRVTVYVTTDDDGSLTAKVWMYKDGSSAKAESAAFVNTYTDPGKADSPLTGDLSNPLLWIALAAFSTAMLLLLLFGGFRRKKDFDSYWQCV